MPMRPSDKADESLRADLAVMLGQLDNMIIARADNDYPRRCLNEIRLDVTALLEHLGSSVKSPPDSRHGD